MVLEIYALEREWVKDFIPRNAGNGYEWLKKRSRQELDLCQKTDLERARLKIAKNDLNFIWSKILEIRFFLLLSFYHLSKKCEQVNVPVSIRSKNQPLIAAPAAPTDDSAPASPFYPHFLQLEDFMEDFSTLSSAPSSIGPSFRKSHRQ